MTAAIGMVAAALVDRVLSTAVSGIIIILPGPPGSGIAPDPSPGVLTIPPAAAPTAPAPTGAGGGLGAAVGGVGNGLGQAASGLGQGVGGTAQGLGSGVGGAVGGLARGADLSGWKLSVPVKNGKGSATSINPAQGDTGPWMTRSGDGSLKFWAPVHGTTTPNSTHTRTELDSLHNFTAGSGVHILRATVSVEQVPTSRPDIIIGQIHGADSISSSSFVMLHYDGGQCQVVGVLG